MKQTLLSLLALSLCCSWAQKTQAQNVNPHYIDGSIYLKLKDTCTLELSPYLYTHAGFNLLCVSYGIDVPNIRKPFPDTAISTSLSKIYQLRFTDTARVDSLIAKLNRFAEVDYAEMEPAASANFIPNDLEASQWSLTKINAFGAWDISKGSANVVIAIVDNGVRTTHADLSPNLWVNPGEIPGNLLDDDFNGYTDDFNGYDVADDDGNPNPPPGTTNSSLFVHGTHCAGIASAKTNNATGMASIGFNCKIMAVKCAPDNGSGDLFTNSYDGVYYAMREGANVISMSFSGKGSSITGQSLMNTASSRGIVLVAAAGNNKTDSLYYPAAYSKVIAVGATDESDQKASYSNYGSYVDVMAPGNNIYSALAGSNNSYGKLSGTSMATPLVAGLAALVKAANPGFNPAQIEAAIKKGCEKIDLLNPSFSGKLGAGRINAYFTLNPSAIIQNDLEGHSLAVYPNPFSASLHVRVQSANPGNISLDIMNLMGERILTVQPTSNTFELNTVPIPTGVYILKISSPDGVVSKKLIRH